MLIYIAISLYLKLNIKRRKEKPLVEVRRNILSQLLWAKCFLKLYLFPKIQFMKFTSYNAYLLAPLNLV